MIRAHREPVHSHEQYTTFGGASEKNIDRIGGRAKQRDEGTPSVIMRASYVSAREIQLAVVHENVKNFIYSRKRDLANRSISNE